MKPSAKVPRRFQIIVILTTGLFCSTHLGLAQTNKSIEQSAPAGLAEAFSAGVEYVGEAGNRRNRWPLKLRLLSFDTSTGQIIGEIEWLTMDSIHRIEGTLADDVLKFKETAIIRKGSATPGPVYTLSDFTDGRLEGRWKFLLFKGYVWIELPDTRLTSTSASRTPETSPAGTKAVPETMEDGPKWVKPVADILIPGGSLGDFHHGTYPSLQDKEGGNRTHLGVDVLAPCGTPIFSIPKSTVVAVIATKDHLLWPALGYSVMLRRTGSDDNDSKPEFVILLHLESPSALQPSDQVEAWKTEIGQIGRTGAVVGTGCHTHLEQRNFDTWLYPAWGNIYAPGDVTASSDFLDNWTNPESSEPLNWIPDRFTFSQKGDYIFHYGRSGRETLLCSTQVTRGHTECLGGLIMESGTDRKFYDLAGTSGPKALPDGEVVFLARPTASNRFSCGVLFTSGKNGSRLHRVTDCLRPQSVSGFELASDSRRGWVAVYQQDGEAYTSEITVLDTSGAPIAQLLFDLQEIQAGSMAFLHNEPRLIAAIFHYLNKTLSIYEIDIPSDQRRLLAQYPSGAYDLNNAGLAISTDDRYVVYRAPTGEKAGNNTYPLEQYEIFLVDRSDRSSKPRQLTRNYLIERAFHFLPGDESLLVATDGAGLQVLALTDGNMEQILGFDVEGLAVSYSLDMVAFQIFYGKRGKTGFTPAIDLAVMNPDGSAIRSVLGQVP